MSKAKPNKAQIQAQLASLLRYDPAYDWRGGARALIDSIEPEVILCGPAETGKTWASCYKAHMLAREYKGANGALIRKVAATIPGTVWQTMRRVIGEFPVNPYGGEHNPECLIYPNGSRIWIGGMDNPKKVLSGERDWIQVCQAEELTQDDWEIFTTRTTGRGAVVPHPQIFGDCNPAGTNHFIRQRGRIRLIQSKHTDNPTLYDAQGNLTAQGKRTIATLSELTGVRRKRLLEGEWATAEGAVYDTFSTQTHVKRRDAREFREWFLGLDEGYTNPAVILLVGVDGDGRLHVAREFYKRGVLQAEVVKVAKEWYKEVGANVAYVDAAAAGLIADLQDAGINAIGAKGRVLDGIQEVQKFLAIAGDGLPRLTVDPDCVNFINEFESYIWKPLKDEPLKQNDHCPDAIRYPIVSRRDSALRWEETQGLGTIERFKSKWQ